MLSKVKYVPSWLPGATFQRKAAAWRKATTQMKDLPFSAAKKAMVRVDHELED